MVNNVTQFQNITTLTELLSGINTSSDYLFGAALCAAIALIIIFALKSAGHDLTDSLAAGAGVNMVLSTILYFIKNSENIPFISFGYWLFSIVALGGIMVYYINQR